MFIFRKSCLLAGILASSAAAEAAQIDCTGVYLGGERIRMSSDPSLLSEGGDVWMQFDYRPQTPLDAWNGMHLEYKITGRQTIGGETDFDLEMLPSDAGLAKRVLKVDLRGKSGLYNMLDNGRVLLVTPALNCK